MARDPGFAGRMANTESRLRELNRMLDLKDPILTLVVSLGVLVSPIRATSRASLGDANAVVHDSSPGSLSLSLANLRDVILQAQSAATVGNRGTTLTVEYPFDEAAFPPDMAPPTFVWSDPCQGADAWAI